MAHHGTARRHEDSHEALRGTRILPERQTRQLGGDKMTTGNDAFLSSPNSGGPGRGPSPAPGAPDARGDNKTLVAPRQLLDRSAWNRDTSRATFRKARDARRCPMLSSYGRRVMEKEKSPVAATTDLQEVDPSTPRGQSRILYEHDDGPASRATLNIREARRLRGLIRRRGTA